MNMLGLFNAKRAGGILLAVGLLCGAIDCAGAALAANAYSVTLETKGDPTTFDISSPENPAIRLVEVLPKDSKVERSVAGGVGYYTISIVLCGKKSNHRWNLVGRGVTITTFGCGSISFVYKR